MTQPTDSEKQAILEQILKSPGFQESKRYRDLLQYLVEKSSEPGLLKETEIAQAVFGKDENFDPTTDPIIRSYVSNLRKKLDHFYLTTDEPHEYRLEIPKGHYAVRFSVAVPEKPNAATSRQLSILYPIIIVLLVVAVVVLVFREYRGSTTPPSTQPRLEIGPLWAEFTQPNSRPVLVVLGDFFFLRERGSSDSYYRKSKINNLDEYLEYISKNPQFAKQYTRNSFTYLRPSAPWGLLSIFPILQHAPGGFTLKLASQFTSDDFKSNNVIFVGSFRTLYLLKNFLGTFKLDYSTTPYSTFSVRDGIGDSLHLFKPPRLSAGNLEQDFGIIAKGQGPDGSTILMLLGFSESGVIQAAHVATDPQLMKKIAEHYPGSTSINPTSLTLVIAAEGITQSLFDPDIKYLAGVGPPTLPATKELKDTLGSK